MLGTEPINDYILIIQCVPEISPIFTYSYIITIRGIQRQLRCYPPKRQYIIDPDATFTASGNINFYAMRSGWRNWQEAGYPAPLIVSAMQPGSNSGRALVVVVEEEE